MQAVERDNDSVKIVVRLWPRPYFSVGNNRFTTLTCRTIGIAVLMWVSGTKE